MRALGQWWSALAGGEERLDQPGAGERRTGTTRRRYSQARPANRQRSRFALEIERWLAINHWTPDVFAALTEECRDPALMLSEEEIEAILSGSRLDLMPRHFRAFAAVEALTRAERASQPSTDQELIAWFSSSICLDETSLQASWWFALYCGEPWAFAKLRAPAAEPLHAIGTLRRALPPLLRQAIAARGLDPVDHLRSCAQRLPRSSALKPQRFVDWILDYDRLDERELRLAIAFAMLQLAAMGQEFDSLLEVPVSKVAVEPVPGVGRPQLLRA